MFKKELINFNIQARNWEDALENTCNILEKNGYIEHKYINKLINITKEIGPYYIITSNVGIPHLRPDEGVIKSGLAFFKLRNKVDFSGNKIQYLIYILALNSNEHIDKIQSITSILEDKNLFESLNNNKFNIDEFIKYINNKGDVKL